PIESKLKAKKLIALEIDVLTCFLFEESFGYNVRLLDVSYRIKESNRSIEIYRGEKVENDAYVFNLKGSQREKVEPVFLSKQRLEEIIQSGLLSITAFIHNQQDHKLRQMLLGAIKKLASANREDDMHERAVKIISAFELLCIEGHTGKGQTKLKKRFIKKVIHDDPTVESLGKAVKDMYRIRDRYLHNSERLSTDHVIYYQLQKLCIFLIVYSIEMVNNGKIQSLDEYFAYFDKTSK
ncbi:MAG: hypothetical protein AAF740_06905, partial [Bacteroidota bacterium]